MIPYIDSHYQPCSFSIFGSHSAGGLLTIYSLIKQSAVFNCYIAGSPTLSWDSEVIINLAEKSFQLNISFNNFSFISFGSKDYPKYIKATQNLLIILENQQPRGLVWRKIIYDRLEHMDVANKSFIDSLKASYSQKRNNKF